MSGIHSALSLGADVLAVAWDMPFVDGRLLRHLKAIGDRENAGAVIPESDSPYGIEPFCAWYSWRAFPAFDRFLREGGGAARHLIAALPDVVPVPLADTRSFGDPATMFMSVNTPEDLARARAVADPTG